jgi:hypothetical protein
MAEERRLERATMCAALEGAALPEWLAGEDAPDPAAPVTGNEQAERESAILVAPSLTQRGESYGGMDI